MTPPRSSALLEVQELKTVVHGKAGGHAVDDVSFHVRRGETLGLVGESGSGKSLTALSVLRLNPRPATEIVSGRVLLDGVNVLDLDPRSLRRFWGNRMAIILQDPNTALNPVWPIGEQVAESIRLHRGLKRKAARWEAIEMLRLLQVADAEARFKAYPSELSGGMRQRAMAAAALASQPMLLVADEPTTALDVTVQAAFLRHLRKLQTDMELGILFITHDFGVVSSICDRVAVMYAGQLVEEADVSHILANPAHPYTQALVKSVPSVRHRSTRLISIPGDPPRLDARPSGCPFRPRCWLYEKLGRPEICRRERPTPSTVAGSRSVLCHFGDEATVERLNSDD